MPAHKFVPVPLCPPQIPHGQTLDPSWTSTVIGSSRDICP